MEPYTSLTAMFQGFMKDLIAGTVAGISSTVFGHPLDTIKLRMQVATQKLTFGNCIKEIIRKEGVQGFFKGLYLPVIGNAPVNALVFSGNQMSKRMLQSINFMSQNQKVFMSGCMGGLASLIFFVPIELLKVRAQNHNTSSLDVKMEINRIIQLSGARGLYKGFWSQFYRDVPSFGLYFLAYHQLQVLFGIDPSSSIAHLSYMDLTKKLCAGGIAGQINWIAGYPFDLIKSYIQTQHNPCSMLYATKHIFGLNGGGLKNFYKGLSPCVLRAFPVNAIALTAYEYSMHHLDNTDLYLF